MRTMKELFKEPLEKTKPLTKDALDAFNVKEYFNGEEVCVGDIVLFALLVGDVIEKDKEGCEGTFPQLPMTVIRLNERHFELFEEWGSDFPVSHKVVPIIKLKK